MFQLDAKLNNRFSLALALYGGYFYPLAPVLGGTYCVGSGAGVKWSINNDVFNDGWYVQSLMRFMGISWFDDNNLKWSLIPSIDAGYAWYWPNGFWLSIGPAIYWQIPLVGLQDIYHRYLAFPMLNVGTGYAW
jgi:hypothetical protein